MKGIVFTEFSTMVEEKFGFEVLDDIIMRSGIASGGSYTAVGTYPHEEMIALVVALSETTGIAVPDLVKAFGAHLFDVFSKNYGVFFANVNNAFDFFESIETYIHVEVHKLYPEAELPKFTCQRSPDDKQLLLTYSSPRPFADLAEGLITSCLKYFGEQCTITRTDASVPEMNIVHFDISRISL